jgi:hypothetical protein
MAIFIDDIYGAENCRLNAYAAAYKSTHTLGDPAEIWQRLQGRKEKYPDSWTRVVFILNSFKESSGKEKLLQKDLADSLGVARQTVASDVKLLLDLGLLESSKGYLPSPKLNRFLRWLEENHPDLLGSNGR